MHAIIEQLVKDIDVHFDCKQSREWDEICQRADKPLTFNRLTKFIKSLSLSPDQEREFMIYLQVSFPQEVSRD